MNRRKVVWFKVNEVELHFIAVLEIREPPVTCRDQPALHLKVNLNSTLSFVATQDHKRVGAVCIAISLLKR